MPKLLLSVDIGTDKQKFEFPAEFVDAATAFIGTQTSGNPPVAKYTDVHSLVVSHIESLADSLLDLFPQKTAATAKAQIEAAQETLRIEREKFKKPTKV